MRLSPAEVQQFNTQGFLLLPGLLAPDEVAVLRDELPRIFALERPEIHRAENGELRFAMGLHRYSEAYARLARHPRLIEPARQLLAGPVYAHQYKVNHKEPFGQLDFPWHQDFASWQANEGMPEPQALNAAVFLDEVTEFNGPLTFIPGSHANGRLPSRAEVLPGSEGSLYTVEPETVRHLAAANGLVAPKGPAGSGLLFHCCTAHASSPNLSPWTRYIIYLSLNRTENGVRRPSRPDYYTNRDFTPIEPLADDCLLQQ